MAIPGVGSTPSELVGGLPRGLEARGASGQAHRDARGLHVLQRRPRGGGRHRQAADRAAFRVHRRCDGRLCRGRAALDLRQLRQDARADGGGDLRNPGRAHGRLRRPRRTTSSSSCTSSTGRWAAATTPRCRSISTTCPTSSPNARSACSARRSSRASPGDRTHPVRTETDRRGLAYVVISTGADRREAERRYLSRTARHRDCKISPLASLGRNDGL